MTLKLSTAEVWQTIEKELFAVVGMVNAAGEARTAGLVYICLLYTSPSPRDRTRSRMPSSA